MQERVTVDIADGVATVTLNRPEGANAIDLPMAERLMRVATACDADPAIRAVLLRAEGKLFCAGGDVGAFVTAGDATSALLLEITACLHSAVSRFARMEKPLVTAVQGFAAGAGFSLAMLGDIVVAGEAAQFTLAYTGIGLTPDGGASWLLPRLVGMRRAQQLVLLNPRLDAAAALREGLVTEVVADVALHAHARAIAGQLAAGPTRAFGRARMLLLESFTDTLEGHLEREARAIAASGATADGREGIAAFAARRPPVFRGA